MAEKFNYKIHPEKCAPDDFWGQVRRTVNGAPVSPDQIDMIVKAISKGLKICGSDVVLDLCCGNGALSTYIFSKCRSGLGVDYSPPLIGVANQNFKKPGHEFLIVKDVVEYVAEEHSPERFNKALCYGAFQYLRRESAYELLLKLHDTFSSLERLFVGNLPDKDEMPRFYENRRYTAGIENDHSSDIGLWRTKSEFSLLARQTGWSVEFSSMPREFYAAYYRYDAILAPGEQQCTKR
ncbi:hypothetical protein DSCW_11680 [Desulfosarcina widdelii]|uniref:Methyltransferase domain-containing protein n=1 Tax=Desulfosarcina widdelii TaxID=947919 RepID=A0A5K7Z2K4_9BACT|nr:class I SAM-dependent methyltransferase [Desulfosarcina widdelii]BBO73751.1 hypothetical protein DSCW_11680 [Desulfosarcina widdelii]